MKHFLPLILSVAALFASAVTASAAGGEAHDGVGTEISVQNTDVSVRVSHSGFEVHNASQEPCAVEVYSLTGSLVLSAPAPSGVTSFQLRPGHYIIRLNGRTLKVVIK